MKKIPLTKNFVENKDLKGLSDGHVIHTGSKLSNKDFKSEKDLGNFIAYHVQNFTEDILCDSVIESFREYKIEDNVRFGNSGLRIDLLITGAKRNYIIEFKKPHYNSENRKAIGQVLNYGRLLQKMKPVLCIITTSFDIDTAETIGYYNLPIRYFYINEDQILEYKGVGK